LALRGCPKRGQDPSTAATSFPLNEFKGPVPFSDSLSVDRWFVAPLNISCASFGSTWAVSKFFFFYDQKAVETFPCPHCGAYTLCCHEQTATSVSEQPRRRWQMASSL